jgi:hypothetical protein
VSASFDRFCLAAGIETLGAMMEADAEAACGPRHSRSVDRLGHRWGRTARKIGFHVGKEVARIFEAGFVLSVPLSLYKNGSLIFSIDPAVLDWLKGEGPGGRVGNHEIMLMSTA